MTTPSGGGGPGNEHDYPDDGYGRYGGFDAEQDTGNLAQPARHGPPAGTGGWPGGGVEEVGVDDLLSRADPGDVPPRPRRGWRAPGSGRGESGEWPGAGLPPHADVPQGMRVPPDTRVPPGTGVPPGMGVPPEARVPPDMGVPADARGPLDSPPTRPVSGRSHRPQRAAGFGRKIGDGAGWVRERAAGGLTTLRNRRAETPAASRRRAPGTQPAALQALPLAMGMFTVLPVPPSRAGRDAVDSGHAGWALRWLPVLGGLLAALAWAVSLVFWRGHGTGAVFVGAVVWVGVMALLTRGLHLDGLADLADGLGSRRPAEEALAIMRRSDIGPFGVSTVVAVLLLQLGAVLTMLGSASRAQGLVVLVVVAVTGRLAVLDAARPAVPPARPGGFGALVAGTASATVRAAAISATLVLGWLVLALTATSLTQALWLPFAALVGLVAGRLATWHAVRRLDGITGDVFGAVLEISTAVALLAVAAVVAWGGLL